MTREEYITDIKTRFGEQRSKDGMLIRDMDDEALLEKMLTRYPGDRDEIDDLTETETEKLPTYPKTEVQKELDEKKQSFLSKIKDRFSESRQREEEIEASGDTGLSKFVQKAGEGASLIGGLAEESIKAMPGIGPAYEFASEKTGEVLKKGVIEPLSETPLIKGAAEGYEAVERGEAEAGFEQVAPELLRDVSAAGEVAGLALGAKGAQQTLKAVDKAVPEIRQTVTKIADEAKAKREAKADDEVLEYVTPKPTELTPTEYEKALSFKRITPKTAREPAKYNLSENERQVALKYKDAIDKDPVQTSINIFNKVADLDEQVGTFLQSNNAIFNKGELRNRLMEDLEDVDDITLDSDRVARAKANIVNNFVEKLEKGDMHALWEARKAFDRSIEKAFSGSPTLQKEIKVRFRNAIQDFIADGTPEGQYKAFMKDMSNLLRLQETVATKAAKERALDKIQLWIKENPKKAKAIGWGVGLGTAGTAGAIAF